MILLLLLLVVFSRAEEHFKEINQRNPNSIPEFLQNRITVNFKEATLVEVLMTIAEVGGFHINFNRSQMSVDKIITLKRKEEPALDVLLTVLKDSDVKLLTSGDNSLLVKPSKISRNSSGIIKGRVVDSETQIPLIGTNIVVVGKGMGGSTDDNGRYFIPNIPKGKYRLEFSYIGYEAKQFNDIEISPKSDVLLDVQLKPAALHLKEIVITPGKFAVMGREPIVRQTLTEQNLETIPFGEDIYRAITRLPGVAASEYTAKFTVRGGKNEEILTLMDGLELYEPFHLKDVEGGILSIIDVKAIEGIDLYTGGFPAQYGEYLSGVFNMKSASPAREQSRTSLGISFMNAKFMSEGSFNQNKGSWLVSARRGYLDLVLKLMDEEDPPLPKYYDTFAKLKYQFGKKYTLSANMIHSEDKLDFVEEEAGDVFDTRYGNSYGWITLNSIMNPRLLIKSLLSFGRITHDRRGIGYFDDSGVTQYTVDDQNRVNIFSLKQDWDFELSEHWFLKWGVYYNYQSADYDYANSITHFDWINQYQSMLPVDTNSVSLNPKGERFGGYFSNRVQIFLPLNVELGLRYDRNGYTADRYLSPRVNFVYAFGKQTFLRGGWGHFNQSQRMHEIKVAYGETDFFPAQKSKHWVLGLEHTHRNGLNLRLEAYYKKISQLRPDYRIFSNDIEVFPEVQEDDLFALTFNGARSKGLEFYLKYDEGGKFSCWTSYALAYTHENVQNLIYQGETTSLPDPVVPNRYDQRHTVYLDFNYRPNRKWHFNISWQYHTGWPYTQRIIRSEQQPDGSIQYIAEYDKLYGAQLPAYHRLDIQLSRHFFLSKSQITLFVAVINLYNRDNIRNIKYSVRRDPDGVPYLFEQKGYWFPLLPSLGVNWTWRH
jgi:outer membrane receptor for ferrienterochelin and colicin